MSDPRPAMEHNELAFVAQHRSAHSDLGFAHLMVSANPDVTHWNFAGAFRGRRGEAPAIIARSRLAFAEWGRRPCMKITPMSRPADLEEQLLGAGWSPRGRFVHMLAQESPRRINGEVAVRACESRADLDLFSELQNRAFDAPREWLPWFAEVNRRNFARRNQIFYLAALDGREVGVCLLLSQRRVGGLYAVATLPEVRGRGVAAALVGRALADSQRLGNTLTCLNTLSGGPAEEVFARLGFGRSFESVFYTP